jgi:hypothetical protein
MTSCFPPGSTPSAAVVNCNRKHDCAESIKGSQSTRNCVGIPRREMVQAWIQPHLTLFFSAYWRRCSPTSTNPRFGARLSSWSLVSFLLVSSRIASLHCFLSSDFSLSVTSAWSSLSDGRARSCHGWLVSRYSHIYGSRNIPSFRTACFCTDSISRLGCRTSSFAYCT